MHSQFFSTGGYGGLFHLEYAPGSGLNAVPVAGGEVDAEAQEAKGDVAGGAAREGAPGAGADQQADVRAAGAAMVQGWASEQGGQVGSVVLGSSFASCS